MYVGAVSVRPLAGYKLLVVFEDGQQRIFDMRPYLRTGIFAGLRDPDVFNSARISFDTVEWSNGADLCPEVLYREGVPVRKKQGNAAGLRKGFLAKTARCSPSRKTSF